LGCPFSWSGSYFISAVFKLFLGEAFASTKQRGCLFAETSPKEVSSSLLLTSKVKDKIWSENGKGEEVVEQNTKTSEHTKA